MQCNYKKYIREIHNNAIKANYFSVFKNLFSSNNKDEQMKIDDQPISLSQIFYAVSLAVQNHLEELDIIFSFDDDIRKTVSSIYKNDAM